MAAAALILFTLVTASSAAANPAVWEPVVIEGAKLGSMLGQPLRGLEVLAWRDGKLSPIPFQVDPAEPAGSVSAAACGPSSERSGSFQAGDELALMAADFGDAAPATASLPRGTVELAILDPRGGSPRYAYLAVVKNPRRSQLSYVQIDDAADRVETDFYRVGFTDGWPSDFADQGRRAEHGPNLIRQLTVSLSARVFGFIPYAMTEHDLRISQPAVSCGPVRVILRYRYAVTMIAGIRSPSITVPIAFYRQYVVSPVAVRFPWLPRLFFRGTHIRINLAYAAPRHVTMIWQGDQTGLPLGEVAAGQQTVAVDSGPSVDWLALRQGGHLLIQAFPPSDFNLVSHHLSYRAAADGIGTTHGSASAVEVGYEVSRLEDLSSGKHVFAVCLAVLDRASDPQVFIGELRAAPAITIRPLPISAGY